VIHPLGNNNEPAIEAEALAKHYGQVRAVDGLDLTVPRGEVFGFLGPNGAGKTTTIRMLLGLIRPNRGTVRLLGRPITDRSTLAKVGCLVETPTAYAHLTGRENLEVTRRMLAAPRENIARSLEQVGLSAAADRPVRGYSLGMKGRLGLAMALLADPHLLILDEPTNGLDPAGIREVRDLIKSLPERGITVLVSSHLLAEIEQVATRVGIVNAGRMRFSGSVADLRAHSAARLEIATDRPAGALEIVRRSHPDATLEGTVLTVAAPESAAAGLNRRLVEAGIGVTRLQPRTASLEELFLQLTTPSQSGLEEAV
jgi:ABC-type multidrug transport system ATPase subunit